jgi:ubiquinone/menaquinone biosynthesis C-methylase UbiE
VLAEKYQLPIFDMGEENEEMRGIFSAGYDNSTVDRYLHDQFRENAETYVDKTELDLSKFLLSSALNVINLKTPVTEELHILELGAGAGGFTVPLAKFFPNSLVIASELSPEMLFLLKTFLVTHLGENHNCVPFQLNAEQLEFTPESFDFIIGSSLLHHLLMPHKTLKACARILKKGGYGIFFDPFENGYGMLRLIYSYILKDHREHTLPPEIKSWLQGVVQHWGICIGRDKTDPVFSKIDDKWLFTKEYFKEIASNDFSECLIHNPFPRCSLEAKTEINLKSAMGKGRSALPQWAWEMIQEYDRYCSGDLRKEMIFEGCVILKK